MLIRVVTRRPASDDRTARR